MSLNIKNPKAHALAQRLAGLTGETLTEAVTRASSERLERIEPAADFDEALYRKLRAIAADCRKMPGRWSNAHFEAREGASI